MTFREAEIWVAEQQWVWAKSYAESYPHFYTTRQLSEDESEFEDFLRLIRKEGVLKTFWKKQYLYLPIGEFEYWEMGRPIPAVQVLNKAPIDDKQKFRFPVKPWEEQTLKQTLQTREDFLQNLLQKKTLTEIETRQLNFLMDTTRKIHGGGKNIIDNSNLKIRYE